MQLCPNWQYLRDSHGDTPLMAWIKKYGPQITFLPSEFLCPGTEHLTNNDGFTALTLWISHTQLEIPNQLKFYGW